jgi:hypothetical protein
MYIYKVERSFWNILLEKVGGFTVIRDPTMHPRDILRKAKGDHLDRVHSDHTVLELIRRERLVFFSEAMSLKTILKKTIRLESTQIRWYSYSG